MIARLWRGTARDPDGYLRHLRRNVIPRLKKISGYREVRVLRRDREILVVTFRDSMQPIRAFAGEDVEKAVVEPEARAVLEEFDDVVRHYEVVE